MQRRCRLIAWFIALAVIPLAGAQAQTQTQMNMTADHQYLLSAERLAAVYNRLRPLLDPAERHDLGEAERAWIAYRDAQARLEAGLYRGGSMQPMVYDNIRKDLTDARIRQLQRLTVQLKDR